MTDEHTLDGREETLERLETAARKRWDEAWAIRAIHFADGTTQAYVFHSRGLVEDDREEKTLEEERLYVVDERTIYRRVHVHREQVVDVCEEHEVGAGTLEG